jgi:hypothetical protein
MVARILCKGVACKGTGVTSRYEYLTIKGSGVETDEEKVISNTIFLARGASLMVSVVLTSQDSASLMEPAGMSRLSCLPGACLSLFFYLVIRLLVRFS